MSVGNLNELLEAEKATPEVNTLDTVAAQAMQNYITAMEHSYMIMAGMSSKNIMRSVLHAIDFNIDLHCPTKLVHEKEANLAAILAQILDLRTLIQANRLRLEQDQNKTTKE